MVTLSSSEVDGLWARYVDKRDASTREKVIVQYVPLVRYVVGRFPMSQSGVLSSEDLVSHGIIGLVQAIERFDPTRGVKFETYAITRIRGAVIDGIRSLNTTGRTAWQRARKIEAAISKLDAELGRTPSDAEVAACIGVDVEAFRAYLSEVNTSTVSLDEFLDVNEDNERPYRAYQFADVDTLSPETAAEQNEMQDSVRQALQRLGERDRLLLTLYYFEELTMRKISQMLHVSESRICQLHTKAILQLRGCLSSMPAMAGSPS